MSARIGARLHACSSAPLLAKTASRALVFALALSGCGDELRPPPRAKISLRDSIRVRRNTALVHRPDTLGARVDTTRVAGADSAPVWVVIVSEFECEECSNFALNTLPEIRRGFVSTGKVRLAFVNFPQDAHFSSRLASHAALCAGAGGRFWEMHDSLYANLWRWKRQPDPQPYMDSLAVAAGVDPAQQRACSSQYRMLNLLSGDIERSQRAGVTTLPSVILGERLLTGSELRLKSLQRAIEEAIPKQD